MPTKAKAAVDVELPKEDVPAEVESSQPPRVLDPAFIKRHNLPDEYVAEVEAGLRPMPPSLGEDHDGSTELLFAGGSWQVVAKGMKPGETTAISR
jgi:hypothetical protein